MPSKSKKQRALMCIALSMKKGKIPKNYSRQAAEVSEGMNEAQLREFCEAPVEEKYP